MFPATSQVKFLIDELNIISSAVLPTKYAEARRLLYLGGGGGEGREGREGRKGSLLYDGGVLAAG